MSNLKYLKKTIKDINEKKNPILNIYIDEMFCFDLKENENTKECGVELLVNGGKARITTRELEKTGLFGSNYELTVRKNNFGNGIDFIMFNKDLTEANIKSIKRTKDGIEISYTKMEQDSKKIKSIDSTTEIYSFSRLRALGTNKDYETEPIQVLFSELTSSKRIEEINPNYKDTFSTKLVKNENKKGLRNITSTTIKGEKFDTEAYSLYSPEESVVAAYRDYAEGELRPANCMIQRKR